MIYGYTCRSCEVSVDIIKRAAEFDKKEHCGKCNEIMQRDFAPQKVHLYGTKVEEAEYNPGLGCVVKNKNHRKEIARIKGVEEIGTEAPDQIHKHFDTRRAQKREQIWNDADKGWVGDGT